MKIKWDPKYVKLVFYSVLVIASTLVLYKLIDNIEEIFSNVTVQFYALRRIMTPFIIAFAVAYLLNPALNWLEGNVLKGLDKTKWGKNSKRTVGILSLYLIFFGFLALIIAIVMPRISKSIGDLVNTFPRYIRDTELFIRSFVGDIEFLKSYDFTDSIDGYVKVALAEISKMLEQMLNNVLRSALVFTTTILNIVLAMVICYYLLKDKEQFVYSSKRLVKAIFSEENAEGIIQSLGEIHQVFSKFIVGKFIDSLIIAIICFIGCLAMNIKYALLIAVVVGITNMIPYFGPFIGAVPSSIIILLDNPVKIVWFLIFLFLLQQFDGNYLGPKILGNKIGVSPLWIIFSIIIGGGMFGVLGMFLGVPAVAFIRMIVLRFVDKRLDQKEREKERQNQEVSSVLD